MDISAGPGRRLNAAAEQLIIALAVRVLMARRTRVTGSKSEQDGVAEIGFWITCSTAIFRYCAGDRLGGAALHLRSDLRADV